MTVGAITVLVSSEGLIRFVRTDDGTELLTEERAHVWWPGPCLYTPTGNGHHRLEQRFCAYEGEKLYGLGQHQHGRLDQKGTVLDLVQRNAEVPIPVGAPDRARAGCGGACRGGWTSGWRWGCGCRIAAHARGLLIRCSRRFQ